MIPPSPSGGAELKKRRLLRRASRLTRAAGKVAWAFLDRRHPLLAHVVPVRRCNLSCTYCNEYDAVSKPVPLPLMLRRLDLLAELGTAMITFSGGEPLLHPDLDTMITRTRERSMISSLITNGYHLSPERIAALNDAGLDYLQISIDNVEPDDVSLKSLRLLEPKLRWLADHALFGVNINSVVGAGVRNPEDALAVARRARELGFTSSVGILHDGQGQLKPLSPREMAVYEGLKAFGSRGDTRVNASFQDNLAAGRPNKWSCRAGSRYLYVDEAGLVSYCSQMRGSPGIPLESYGRADLRREYDTPKACAPYCTVNCAQRVALFDNWRSPQKAEATVPVRTAPAGRKDEALAG
jgi:MoaA/NifB/PqqE/SkfB family radical SAM enzyme